MFASNSPSLSDIAAVTGNNRSNSGWGDGDGWWVLILQQLRPCPIPAYTVPNPCAAPCYSTYQSCGC